MNNRGKILFGAIIGITAMTARNAIKKKKEKRNKEVVILLMKMWAHLAYEYGRYSAIHEIYKRGWKVVVDDDQEESETTENNTNSTKEES